VAPAWLARRLFKHRSPSFPEELAKFQAQEADSRFRDLAGTAEYRHEVPAGSRRIPRRSRWTPGRSRSALQSPVVGWPAASARFGLSERARELRSHARRHEEHRHGHEKSHMPPRSAGGRNLAANEGGKGRVPGKLVVIFNGRVDVRNGRWKSPFYSLGRSAVAAER
jgi:hypothetical protein